MKKEENTNEPRKRMEFSDDVFKPAPPAENKAREQRKIREYQKNRRRMYVIVALIVVIAVSFAGMAAYVMKDVLGLDKVTDEVEVTIPKGASVTKISQILEENGVVENKTWFKIYTKFFAKDAKLNFGTYALDKNGSYKSIISTLEEMSMRTDVVKVTVVEGMTQKEIGELLEEKGVCKKEDFDKVLAEGDFNYEFIKHISDNPLIFNRFEGYLFPDTYIFFLNEDPMSVANKFLSNFNSKITEGIYSKIEQMGMTLGDVISLASVIQAEAGGSPEMYNVSSVLHNRLKNPDVYPNLQCDVTIFYLRDSVEPYLENPDDPAHTPLYNSYDTYQKKGIPIGPIGNPGMDAIDACINPNATPYFFFITDKTGKFYYADSARQHNRNIQIANQINRSLAKKDN